MGEVAGQLLDSKILNETEALILLNETRTPRLDWLDGDDFHDTVVDLISEIKIITGALVYADGTPEQFAQVESMKRFLQSTPRYRRLHAGDVTHAFYMNAAGIFAEKFRHYNRELNAEFLGDVLSAFVAYKDRFLATKLATVQKALNPPQERPVPVFSVQDWQRWINDDIGYLRAGRKALIWNCTPKYNLLRKMGYIRIRSRAHWWQWYRFTVERLKYVQHRKPADTDGARASKKQALAMYDAILQTGAIPMEQHPAMVHHVRRLVYMEHLEGLVSCGITDLFNQVQP